MADNNKDPFEEFEFRPINEGLGFHRKNKTQQSSSISSGFDMGGFTSPKTTQQTFKTKPQPTPAFNTQNSMPNSIPGFSAPLPRNETRHDIGTSRLAFNIPTIEDDSIAKAQTAVNEILKNLNQKRQIDFITETEKQNAELRKSKPIFFAAGLDAMLVLALFLMSMIAMLTITKVDLFMNLSHPETSGMIYVATAGLFLIVSFIYLIVNRAFMGFTPGEWAFDQRCGSQKEMDALTYIPKIAFRTLLVMATGYMLMPLLSYLFNKDIAGQLSGVTLYRKPNA